MRLHGLADPDNFTAEAAVNLCPATDLHNHIKI